MSLDDPALPAVRHLVGDAAIDVLRVPVGAAGGVIDSVRPVHVQYRPGSDVVVRYSARVSWHGSPPVTETLVASSTVNGLHAGVVAVTATTADGPLEVGVWRWPFDPVLAGLDAVVTPRGVAAMLGIDEGGVRLEVVSYRPTERAVIRVTADTETDAGDPSVISYIKVVDPDAVGGVEHRHTSLLAAGVPVPRVTSWDRASGVLVLQPLVGPTLRELIKSDADGWIDCSELDRLADDFADAELSTPTLASRLDDGILYAQLLAQVVPRSRPQLDRLIARFESASRPHIDGSAHGDLHEAQLIVDRGRIVGVLDIDDAGPGAAIDDRANIIARLLFRSIVDPDRPARLTTYAERMRAESTRRFDPTQLGVHIAAALVGLATGPFRLQSRGWQADVAALLDAASASR